MSVHYLHRMDRDLETIRNADDAKTRRDHEMPPDDDLREDGVPVAALCVLAGGFMDIGAAVLAWWLA